MEAFLPLADMMSLHSASLWVAVVHCLGRVDVEVYRMAEVCLLEEGGFNGIVSFLATDRAEGNC